MKLLLDVIALTNVDANVKVRWFCGSDVLILTMLMTHAVKEGNEYIVTIPRNFKDWALTIGNERSTVIRKLTWFTQQGIVHKLGVGKYALDRRYFIEYEVQETIS